MDSPVNDLAFFLEIVEFIRTETCVPHEQTILDVQLENHPELRVAFISSNTNWAEFIGDPYTGFHYQFQSQSEGAQYFHHEFPLISAEQFRAIMIALKDKFGGDQRGGMLGNMYYISTGGNVFAMWFSVPKFIAQFECLV